MALVRRLYAALKLPPALRKVLGGITAAVIALGLIYFDVVAPWDLDALDRMFNLRGPRAPTTPIVIVNIDEDTFDELGKLAATKTLTWPFPRALHGALVEQIASGGPRAIGIDIIFSTPSSHGDADDMKFAESIAVARKVILAYAITVVSEGFYVKHDTNPPLPILREAAMGVAAVNPRVDPDAVIRRMPLRHRVGDEVLDGIDLALYKVAAATGIPVAPLPTHNDVIINARGPRQSFPWVPYHRVVNGDIDPRFFKDKIVLVGPTTPTLKDLFLTAFERSGQMPGVEIHAHAVDTFVRGDYIRETPRWLSPLLVLIFAPLGSYFVVRLRAFRAFAAVGAVWFSFFAVSFVSFTWKDLWILQVGPTFGLVLGYGITSIEHFIREQREKRRLSQFFSPDVLREIVRHPDHVQLGSKRHLITVFFSDLRGFTSLSEKMEPEVVAEMLREYLSEMTEVVFRHSGTVDKYIGDCVMAIWNAPFEDPNHAVNAVRTALDFQERTLAVSAKWEEKLGGKIRNGVGINTGDAVVGTMGSRQRLEYTAIGDTVNLAARLESITKDYNASIIISESTHDYVKGQFMTRQLGAVTVKGKTRPVKIFQVLPSDIRSHPRAALDSAAVVTLAGLGSTYNVRTKDISETGMALAGVPEELEKGTTVEVCCEGGGLPKPIVVQGMIVWKSGDSAGVRFSDLADDLVPTVSTYVASHDKVEMK